MSDADIQALAELLNPQLLAFVTDETTPTGATSNPGLGCTSSSPNCAYPDPRPEEELDALFLAAVKDFENSQSEIDGICKPKPKGKQARPFAKPVSKEDLDKTMQSAVPDKTQRDTRYCVRIWEEWAEHRASSTGAILPPLKDIAQIQLQQWMSCFVLEIRKKDGTEFPPNSLHHICCGIMRYLRSNRKPALDIFKDKEFAQF